MRGKTSLALAVAGWAVSRLRNRDEPEPPPRRRRGGTAAWAATGALAGVGAAALAGRPRTTRLPGRVALITGGSRGLGLQMAREFGSRGTSVVICARDRDELDRAVADLEARGVRAHGIECDIRDPERVASLVEEAAEVFGRLDFVVNNAGIIQVGPQEVLSEEHFRDAMETMFWAPLRISRAALGPLERTRGSLVTITSIGGYLSVPHLLPYSCAKFAEVALSEGLGGELAERGVRVTTVVPGLMRTGSHKAAVFSGDPEREYTWFSLGAGLPLVSVNAPRAASRIVEGAARGRSHVVLTPLARAAIAARGLSPSLVQNLMGVMDRLLPDAPDGAGERPGSRADTGAANRAVKLVTGLNERASRRLNQGPGGEGPHEDGGSGQG
ncbi:MULTISPECIES: SDR family oxidoreductase [unclassified Nocardiopsis]|uniref:SDR family NAD(P)-dependent oxidoreductase n=1 Tax=unclassified Nocardiopsis TaxID=2649073 RepID=UPI001358E1FD|nr:MULTISPECIES: SDR family oxidoreductase [unclassified Nocardiopsis]